MSFDLASINTGAAADRGATVNIQHPISGAALGIEITVLGSDSREFKRLQREQQNRRLKNQAKNRGKLKLTAEELEEESLATICALVIAWRQKNDDGSWKNTLTINGQELECNDDNKRRIFSDLGFNWLREQVDEEIGDRDSFLKS